MKNSFLILGGPDAEALKEALFTRDQDDGYSSQTVEFIVEAYGGKGPARITLDALAIPSYGSPESWGFRGDGTYTDGWGCTHGPHFVLGEYSTKTRMGWISFE